MSIKCICKDNACVTKSGCEGVSCEDGTICDKGVCRSADPSQYAKGEACVYDTFQEFCIDDKKTAWCSDGKVLHRECDTAYSMITVKGKKTAVCRGRENVCKFEGQGFKKCQIFPERSWEEKWECVVNTEGNFFALQRS